jgi:hypothetical protein
VVDLVAAFPDALQTAAVEVAQAVPEARLQPAHPFTVRVQGEPVVIPYRLYSAEPDSAVLETLSPLHRTMLRCLYTRHHDGRVRQRNLRHVVEKIDPWVAPFVVQLVGEYVVQIVLDVREHLVGVEVPGSPLRRNYGGFAAENREFLELTYQRAASYWDCYYRGLYATRQYYPAFEVLRSLREAAREFGEGAVAGGVG